MTDRALVAFVEWCRRNRDVSSDAYLVRRVFTAYERLDDEVIDALPAELPIGES